MIAELLTTIIMALGVATGNVSSNSYKGGNAFNNVEKQTKPEQRVADINVRLDKGYTKVGTDVIVTTSGTINYKSKYKIEDSNINYIYEHEYFNIANTAYSMYVDYTNSSRYYYEAYQFYEFTLYNAINSNITITLTSTIYLAGDTNASRTVTNQFRDYTNIDRNPIGLTVTNSEYFDEPSSIFWNGSIIKTDESTEIHNTYVTDSVTITITPTVTKKIALRTYVNYQNLSGAIQNAFPSRFQFSGTVTVPTENYEVVDIPNLMYTVLTMPFSFISTAFNLTVFPGTPYALNFGNLFLTIIAVFILMWLINKVLK